MTKDINSLTKKELLDEMGKMADYIRYLESRYNSYKIVMAEMFSPTELTFTQEEEEVNPEKVKDIRKREDSIKTEMYG